MAEISFRLDCISCYFLNPTHKQFVVTALGWDHGILQEV